MRLEEKEKVIARIVFSVLFGGILGFITNSILAAGICAVLAFLQYNYIVNQYKHVLYGEGRR